MSTLFAIVDDEQPVRHEQLALSAEPDLQVISEAASVAIPTASRSPRRPS